MNTETCPNCSGTYDSIGRHWTRSKDCEHPPLSQRQKDVSIGLLMGDGTLYRRFKNAKLACKMTNKEYLEQLENIFGCFSVQSKLDERGEDRSPDGNGVVSDNPTYQNVYRWFSRAHPWFNTLRSWYTDSGKVWPRDIELTPTVLKHWYVGDGGLKDDGIIRISTVNECENREKIAQYFTNANLPQPQWPEKTRFSFSVDESKELFNYMGKPLRGFEYKWI